MLVLSRCLYEKIVIPSINTSIQVLAARSGRFRVGIEAPSDVAVLREEVLVRGGSQEPATIPLPAAIDSAKLRELNHFVRNRLNAATVGLALLRRQLHAGLARIGLEGTLDKIEKELDALQQR